MAVNITEQHKQDLSCFKRKAGIAMRLSFLINPAVGYMIFSYIKKQQNFFISSFVLFFVSIFFLIVTLLILYQYGLYGEFPLKVIITFNAFGTVLMRGLEVEVVGCDVNKYKWDLGRLAVGIIFAMLMSMFVFLVFRFYY